MSYRKLTQQQVDEMIAEHDCLVADGMRYREAREAIERP